MSIIEDQENALYEVFLSNPDPRLIAPAEDGAPSVEFRFGGGWRECRIWEGYLDASTILLRQILKRQGLANNLIFPALFNLRHAMEVALKWHIHYAGGIVSKDAGHSLNSLIDSFRRTADDLDDEASYISDYMLDRVSELAIVDPRSITFRYSTELDGSPIEIAPERWDLQRLIFTVDGLSFWLDNLSGQIDLSRDERYQSYLRDG
ncbi:MULTISPECIES: hypothetical protein [Rhizobium]|uniref:hypothetical protein n=1 Tax=Rhizobium TaxID=379 RepID=UPI00103B6CD1|nr:hypothetical protein [Rhizobium leguminosarum]NKL95683.1 hypothetical protein [Rhizobium leguminosarum bv. viciae]TCA03524.1 hypothetical protein E0H57_18380 [Rhizobium leguminosarum bv. viciae]UFW78274.1 hypothetical protein RlegSU303_24160 [Rhizobium leguminosarum bv. viciae]